MLQVSPFVVIRMHLEFSNHRDRHRPVVHRLAMIGNQLCSVGCLNERKGIFYYCKLKGAVSAKDVVALTSNTAKTANKLTALL